MEQKTWSIAMNAAECQYLCGESCTHPELPERFKGECSRNCPIRGLDFKTFREFWQEQRQSIRQYHEALQRITEAATLGEAKAIARGEVEGGE